MRGNTPISEILKVLKKYNTGTRCFTVEIYHDESGMIKRTDGKLWESFTDLDDCLAILKQHFKQTQRIFGRLKQMPKGRTIAPQTRVWPVKS